MSRERPDKFEAATLVLSISRRIRGLQRKWLNGPGVKPHGIYTLRVPNPPRKYKYVCTLAYNAATVLVKYINVFWEQKNGYNT